MPVSAAAHYPLVTSTAYPALISYLTSNHNAQKVSNWSVSIRVLRSSHASTSKETLSRPKVMYILAMSEFPTESFVLIEDSERETRASIKHRIDAQRQQDILMNTDAILDPDVIVNSQETSQAITDIKQSVVDAATRHTLFTASSHYQTLVTKLNLPPPLGAPSMGDGVTNSQAAAGPGAWLPRGSPIVIEGATYDLSSATRFGVEVIANSSNCEWRVRVGMLQSGGYRSSGAILEVSTWLRDQLTYTSTTCFTDVLFLQTEYLPLLRLDDPLLLLSQIQNFFPTYLTTPTQDAITANNINPVSIYYPSPEQWQEVIPASNEAWLRSLDKAHHVDAIGWKGKERGRRLAYLYIMLLKNQGML